MPVRFGNTDAGQLLEDLNLVVLPDLCALMLQSLRPATSNLPSMPEKAAPCQGRSVDEQLVARLLQQGQQQLLGSPASQHTPWSLSNLDSILGQLGKRWVIHWSPVEMGRSVCPYRVVTDFTCDGSVPAHILVPGL